MVLPIARRRFGPSTAGILIFDLVNHEAWPSYGDAGDAGQRRVASARTWCYARGCPLSPDCSAVKCCCAFSGTHFTFLPSPETAAVMALQSVHVEAGPVAAGVFSENPRDRCSRRRPLDRFSDFVDALHQHEPEPMPVHRSRAAHPSATLVLEIIILGSPSI